MKFLSTLLKGFGCLVFLILIIIFAMAIVPSTPVQYTPSSPPCKTYEEALQRYQSLLAATPSDVREICRPFILTHDKKTPQVFVLLHGLTNCPEQFRKLAEELHAQGHSVVVPLTPFHGNENRLTDKLENLTVEQMLQSADKAIAIAHGLGDKVTLVGLSTNGATVAWYAQNTQIIDRAVLLAPFLGVHHFPEHYLPYLANFVGRLPNHFFWWNPKLKQDIPGPPYAYPRAPSKPIAKILLLAQQVTQQAAVTAPKTRKIAVVTTASDVVINEGAVTTLVNEWNRSLKVTTYEFPAADKVPHDMIDPHQPDQKVDLVYPVLLKLLNE
ncbi:MAG: alpha/beta fold hydrolase [Chthoniobacterales bacterium]